MYKAACSLVLLQSETRSQKLFKKEEPLLLTKFPCCSLVMFYREMNQYTLILRRLLLSLDTFTFPLSFMCTTTIYFTSLHLLSCCSCGVHQPHISQLFCCLTALSTATGCWRSSCCCYATGPLPARPPHPAHQKKQLLTSTSFLPAPAFDQHQLLTSPSF